MTRDQSPLSVDELVQQLKQRVEERRSRGEYPAGLEESLSAHFQRIVAHRTSSLDPLRDQLQAVQGSMGFDPARITSRSERPGGEIVHRLTSRLVIRQTQGVFEQVNAFARAVHESLKGIVEALETPSPLYTDLVGQIDAVMDRLASYERTPVDPRIALIEINRRVEQLEDAESKRNFRPWFSSARFEEDFQGSPEDYQDLYRGLAEHFVGHSPVLDIGCGRGRFLELLGSVGVEAWGVDLDVEQAARARELGMRVETADGLRYLMGLGERSLGGVALMQVVEHLAPQQLVELVALLEQKVKRGGIIVAETINPTSLYVFAHTFYMDPTHVAPVHPAYLAFLFKEAGFEKVEVEWRSPPPTEEALENEKTETMDSSINSNVRRLNQLLFAPQNYALIATR